MTRRNIIGAALSALVGVTFGCQPNVTGVTSQQSGVRALVSCVSGCVAVEVTPDLGFIRAPYSGASAEYTVTNTGQQTATYAITCYWGSGSTQCDSVSQSSLTLDPEQPAHVSAYFHATYGYPYLKAQAGTVSDTGFYKVMPQLN